MTRKLLAKERKGLLQAGSSLCGKGEASIQCTDDLTTADKKISDGLFKDHISGRG